MDLQSVRERVAAGSRRLASTGLVVGSAGNVSERAGDVLVVTPTTADLASLQAEDLALVSVRDGQPLEGSARPTSELAFHLGCITRHGAGAVVHTHSPAATAVACVLEGEVPTIHYAMLLLGGAVPIAPYRTFGTPELAAVVLDALEGKRACLIANHGAVTHAKTVEEAVDLALLLEWTCDVYSRATALGSPRVLSRADLDQALQAFARQTSGGAADAPADGRRA